MGEELVEAIISPEHGDVFYLSVNGHVVVYPTGEIIQITKAEKDVLDHALKHE
jgi:hypothetical protein